MAEKVEAQQTETPPEGPDVDAAELAEAVAALKEEEKTLAPEGDGGQPPAPEEVKDQKQEKPGEDTSPSPSKPEPIAKGKKAKVEKEGAGEEKDVTAATPMIPIERLNKEIAKNADLEASNVFLRSKLDALEKLVTTGDAKPSQVQKAAAEVVDAAKAQRDAIQEKILSAAEQYDNQEISLKDFKRIEIEANKELAKLDHDGLLQEIASKLPAQKEQELDAFSETLIDMLVAKHPYAEVIDKGDKVKWDFLTYEASKQLASQLGRDLVNNQRDLMLLRQRVAELTDTYGPIWYPEAQVAKPQAQPQPKPQEQPAPSPSGNAQARAEKLDMASKFPPNVSQFGSSGSHQEPSQEAVAKMTDEEIEALPAPVRQKFLNQSS